MKKRIKYIVKAGAIHNAVQAATREIMRDQPGWDVEPSLSQIEFKLDKAIREVVNAERVLDIDDN